MRFSYVDASPASDDSRPFQGTGDGGWGLGEQLNDVSVRCTLRNLALRSPFPHPPSLVPDPMRHLSIGLTLIAALACSTTSAVSDAERQTIVDSLTRQVKAAYEAAGFTAAPFRIHPGCGRTAG